MPNWCLNNVTISSHVPEKMKRIRAILESDAGLFQSLVPNPSGDWEYSWSVENWGTKWDVLPKEINVIQNDDETIIIEFDTAWAPPIGVFEKLEQEGYLVYAMYNEPGIEFCGIYEGGENNCLDYGDMTLEDLEEQLDLDLEQCFGIIEYKRDIAEDE